VTQPYDALLLVSFGGPEGPIVAEGMGVNVAETGSPWRPVGVRWLDFRERRDRGSDFDDCF
jgi:hypothetical protein